ncbi:MAG: hypothetical protein AB1696_14025 [Planctomycetota bacterium]
MDKGDLQITNLVAASGKKYEVNRFAPGALQYIDRDYVFDHVPDFLEGTLHIRTAGDDKMIGEDAPCVTFEVDSPVTVHVVYADKLRVPPRWLREFTDTREKATRDDTDTTTLKGIFTLFARDFEAGRITLNGNLSREMREDAQFKARGGGTYCMYSVVVARRRA